MVKRPPESLHSTSLDITGFYAILEPLNIIEKTSSIFRESFFDSLNIQYIIWKPYNLADWFGLVTPGMAKLRPAGRLKLVFFF